MSGHSRSYISCWMLLSRDSLLAIAQLPHDAYIFLVEGGRLRVNKLGVSGAQEARPLESSGGRPRQLLTSSAGQGGSGIDPNTQLTLTLPHVLLFLFMGLGYFPHGFFHDSGEADTQILCMTLSHLLQHT